MKKVRFESPSGVFSRMDDTECHSPRPFVEKPIVSCPELFLQRTLLPYSNDPVLRYDNSDSSPYPTVRKTYLPSAANKGSKYIPSNNLDLSMLDASNQEPRRPVFGAPCSPLENNATSQRTQLPHNILSPIENTPPNVLRKDNSFFLKRDNLAKFHVNADPSEKQFNKLSLGKENDNVIRKVPLLRDPSPFIHAVSNAQENNLLQQPFNFDDTTESVCRCHHCIKVIQNSTPHNIPQRLLSNLKQNIPQEKVIYKCPCMAPPVSCCHWEQYNMNNVHNGHNYNPSSEISTPVSPQNAVDKKTWAIKKFEKSKQSSCNDIEKQTNITKEKREPTVADLFKIIKLQNEQLQLLQEKMDKFISASNQNVQPVQNYMTEHTALKTIDTEHNTGVSIGVMTSFEMVRTSTIINKEIVTKSCENAQIQCNRSQINIKEVISKSHPVNLNFLEGIAPVGKTACTDDNNSSRLATETLERNVTEQQDGDVIDEKTFNELSLYNVQVDNATTPMISPDQSLYLDVRDYSDSDSSSSNQSNVGWTYYNKVMNRVNGLLHDSDMPSSASALYKNLKQQCVQLQIDKTNVSVTKRVKFGDDPLGFHQPNNGGAMGCSTDTSMKMNQLAAKYLKTAPATPRAIRPTTTPNDMSFATRNYMEKHKILPGTPVEFRSSPGEMPKFLDITALKQQPKLL